MRHLLNFFLFLLLTLYHSSAISSNLKIVATIKPIHSLVESVTDGILKPLLLAAYTSSVHNHTLKPSDASNLESSDVIFYIDDKLETFVKAFSKKNKKLIQLSKTVNLLPSRPQSFSKNIIHTHEKEDHHIWLSYENAKQMIISITTILSTVDKKNSPKYSENANKAIKKIEQETKRISQELNGLNNKKYIVTHDAYQYFEKNFDLNRPSAILSVGEDSYIGMKSLVKLKKIIKKEEIKCIISTLGEDSINPNGFPSETKIVILDPIGIDIKPGKDAYLTIISNVAKNFRSCLTE